MEKERANSGREGGRKGRKEERKEGRKNDWRGNKLTNETRKLTGWF